jgi:hypothetical protein
MSKLSEAVKALINASHARPGYTRASPQVRPALEHFISSATEKKVGLPAWVTMSVSFLSLLPLFRHTPSVFNLLLTRGSNSEVDPAFPSSVKATGLLCSDDLTYTHTYTYTQNETDT